MMNVKPKYSLVLLILVCFFGFQGCSTQDYLDDIKKKLPPDSDKGFAPKATKIAVLSDIHYMDPSLLQNNATAGTEFNKIFLSEPYKVLLEHSPAILNKVVSELLIERPDIVLVAGDMVKDGEQVGHKAVAGILNQLLYNYRQAACFVSS